jgi:hypothetical protein
MSTACSCDHICTAFFACQLYCPFHLKCDSLSVPPCGLLFASRLSSVRNWMYTCICAYEISMHVRPFLISCMS